MANTPPYSGYKVGAALLDERGQVSAGCNVENASYGGTVCAERNAVFRMVAEGGRDARALVVLTQNKATPCGICLQVLSEFVTDPNALSIFCVDEVGNFDHYRFSELMPQRFSREQLP
jgi:cytidine deaminase